jgi:rhamnosyl/mannosyltransferase
VQVVRVATFGRVARAPVSPSIALWLRRLRPDILHFHHPNPTGELACLLARLVVQYLGCVTGSLTPPEIHPDQHFGPVLRIDSTCPGVNRHDGV